MRLPAIERRTLALIGVLVPILGLFAYVALRSGPLAPVEVAVTRVEARPLVPGLFGIGTVEARQVFKIGPTYAGRVRRVDVNVGDRVKAGQTLGEMEPIDLDARVHALDAAIGRAEAALGEAAAREAQAAAQLRRYEQLFAARMVSEELLVTKRNELKVAAAALAAARGEVARSRAERAASVAQRANLRLVAPVDGLVVQRGADPGTTVVAGQSVVELIEPGQLWVNVRFDQAGTGGLASGQPARIVLRSRDAGIDGRVARVEPRADPVTEEILAKVSFTETLRQAPALGELAEVSVELPALPSAPMVGNAAIRQDGRRQGVWKIVDGRLVFAPVSLGRADLDGRVQVLAGLAAGDVVVTHSARTLTADARIRIVDHLSASVR
ncbi:efflux RND transporter periplasmic adaptor subunit [Azospira restricta]|uniref:Efflux RND transporter periplasmic adaptor subunit n=1 Tax=Azospira restricta TaxID=404405 RepID=A0A974Y5P3_9RHOO|nr:efflux RND transporter periplasmic adaptor subunit [Azospira restricta]QRJ65554.1 efflux RND transporter periplasmic adaptor subunit [Azospira restricta]